MSMLQFFLGLPNASNKIIQDQPINKAQGEKSQRSFNFNGKKITSTSFTPQHPARQNPPNFPGFGRNPSLNLWSWMDLGWTHPPKNTWGITISPFKIFSEMSTAIEKLKHISIHFSPFLSFPELYLYVVLVQIPGLDSHGIQKRWVFLGVFFFFCFFACLFVRLSVCSFVWLVGCLSVCLSVCLLVCLFACEETLDRFLSSRQVREKLIGWS